MFSCVGQPICFVGERASEGVSAHMKSIRTHTSCLEIVAGGIARVWTNIQKSIHA